MARRTSKRPVRIITCAAKPLPQANDLIRKVLRERGRLFNRIATIEMDRWRRYDEIRSEMSEEYREAKDAVEEAFSKKERAFEAINEHKAKVYRSTGKKTDSVPSDLLENERRAKEDLDSALERRKQMALEFKKRTAREDEEFARRKKEYAQKRDPDAASPSSAAQRIARKAAFAEMMSEPEWSSEWKMVAMLNEAAKDLTSQARKQSALTGGMGDETFERFEQAKKKRYTERGQPPLRQSFDGSGKVAVKVKRGLTWGALWGSPGVVSIRPHEESERPQPKTRRPKRQARTSDRVRVPEDRKYGIVCLKVRDPDTGEMQTIEVSTKFNRPIPIDASVTRAWLLVRRIGSRLTYKIQFTVEHESFAEPKRPSGIGTVAVHMGWRQTDEGGSRVACWYGSDGESGEIVLDDRMMTMLHHPDMVKGFRDDHRLRMLRLLGAVFRVSGNRWTNMERMTRKDRSRFMIAKNCEQFAKFTLGEERLFEAWGEWKKQRLSRDPYARTLSSLPLPAFRWARAHGFKKPEERLAWYLWIWARQGEEHLRDYMDGERAAGINRRRYFVRHEAIRLATRYECLVTDNSKFSQLVRRKKGSKAAEDMPEQARYTRKLASPGEARATIRDVFGDARSEVVSSQGISEKCAECGSKLEGDKAARFRECKNHGRVDVDLNAARNMLAKSKGDGGARSEQKKGENESEPVAAE